MVHLVDALHKQIIASRRVLCCSSSNRVVAVKEVMHSHSTGISCLDRLIMATANETPMVSGGREVDYPLHTLVAGMSHSVDGHVYI